MSQELGVTIQNLPKSETLRERNLNNSFYNFMVQVKNTINWLLRPNISTISASYTVGNNDFTILIDATPNNVVVTLPDATISEGRQLAVKRIDGTALDVYVDAFSSQTIDGSLTYNLTQYDNILLHSDGNNWYNIG